MVSDLFAGVEVFREQGRRHHQGVAGVGKSFTGGAIGRKLAGRLQINTRQIEQSVGIFGVIEPAEEDRTRIARAGQRLGMQVVGDPSSQPLPYLRRRLWSFLGRHLAIVEHLGNLEPGFGRPPHVVDFGKLFEVQCPFLDVGRVTLHAVPIQNRADLTPELFPELLKSRRLVAQADFWNKH